MLLNCSSTRFSSTFCRFTPFRRPNIVETRQRMVPILSLDVIFVLLATSEHRFQKLNHRTFIAHESALVAQAKTRCTKRLEHLTSANEPFAWLFGIGKISICMPSSNESGAATVTFSRSLIAPTTLDACEPT